MPPLRNQRHEAYAKEVAKGASHQEAAHLAGYTKRSRSTAYSLSRREDIALRVKELSVSAQVRVINKIARDEKKIEGQLEKISARVEAAINEALRWSFDVDRKWTIAMLVRNAEEARKDKQYAVVRQSVMDAAKVAKVYVERSETAIKFNPADCSDEELERLQEFLERSVPPEIIAQNRQRLLAAAETTVTVEAEAEIPDPEFSKS